MGTYLKKIEELLNQTRSSVSHKQVLMTIAKRAETLGYEKGQIIQALELGITLQNGGKLSLNSLPGDTITKGSASFFLEYILPLHLCRRKGNFVIKVGDKTISTINLN